MRKSPLFFLLICLALAGCSLPGQNTTSTPAVLPVSSATAPPARATSTAEPSPTATSAIQAFHLGEIHMLNANDGWGAGTRGTATVPEIARTTDGGRTWTAVNPPDAVRPENGRAAAFFLDEQHAWVIFTGEPGPELTGATIWRTADGGLSWQGTDIDTGRLMMDYFYPGQVAFFDAQNGWMLVHLGLGMNHDYVAVLTTADGGASWNTVVEPEKNNLWMSCQKNGIWFRDVQHAYAVGTCNGVMAGLYLYDTADGGETWNEVALPAPAETPDAYTNEMSMCEGTDLRFTDAQTGMLVVRCTDMSDMQAQRWLYRTLDGGQNWSPMLLPAALGEIEFLDDNLGWYVAPPLPDSTLGTKVYRTEDAGVIWAELATIDWSGPFSFSDAQNGWIAGGSEVGKAVLHTTDGGVTWEPIPAEILP